jgi:hypothetical protein
MRSVSLISPSSFALRFDHGHQGHLAVVVDQREARQHRGGSSAIEDTKRK